MIGWTGAVARECLAEETRVKGIVAAHVSSEHRGNKQRSCQPAGHEPAGEEQAARSPVRRTAQDPGRVAPPRSSFSRAGKVRAGSPALEAPSSVLLPSTPVIEKSRTTASPPAALEPIQQPPSVLRKTPPLTPGPLQEADHCCYECNISEPVTLSRPKPYQNHSTSSPISLQPLRPIRRRRCPDR